MSLASIQEETIQIDGLEVHYKIAGQPFDSAQGKAVLVLHGWGGSSDSWKAVQVQLAQHGYRVIVPDLPGFGKTLAPRSVWGLQEYLSFVHEFAEKLSLRSFFLIGHSFGGRIAVKFAAQYPDLLYGLVLADSAGIPGRPNFKTKLIRRFVKIGKIVLSPRIFSWMRELAKGLLYTLLRNSDYAKAKGIMRETMKEILKENISSSLPSIKTPTFIIWGEKDRMTPLENAYVFQKNIPNAQLKVFPGVGHSPHLKIPEECASVIADFFKKNI